MKTWNKLAMILILLLPASVLAEGSVSRLYSFSAGEILDGDSMEEIRELLEELTWRGHKLYVATSKPEGMSIDILNHFDLAKYFTMICGAALDLSRNSTEAVIAYLLEKSGEKENMVMVGDTKFDVIGAKHHGIPCIGVSWGYGTVEEMRDAGATAIANTPEELLKLIEA